MSSERPPVEGDLNAVVGRRIAALRRERGLTLRGLADRLGWSFGTLANYERGRRPLSIVRLAEIARALDYAPAALLVEDAEAATIVNAIVLNPTLTPDIAFFLSTLAEPLPEPPE